MGGITPIHGASILVYNVAIACVLVEVVFDEQLSEFGVLVVDSNGKAPIVGGADEIVDYVAEVLFFLFILLGHLIAVIKLNIISGINRFIAAIHFLVEELLIMVSSISLIGKLLVNICFSLSTSAWNASQLLLMVYALFSIDLMIPVLYLSGAMLW